MPGQVCSQRLVRVGRWNLMQCLPFEQMPSFTPTSQVLGLEARWVGAGSKWGGEAICVSIVHARWCFHTSRGEKTSGPHVQKWPCPCWNSNELEEVFAWSCTPTCQAWTCVRLGSMEPRRAGLPSGNGHLASRWKQKGKEHWDSSEGKAGSEMVTSSEQVCHGAWWPSYSQGSRPSLIQHTSYFQCYLQLFIITTLHFSQMGLLTALPDLSSPLWFCSCLLLPGMPAFNTQIYLLQGDFPFLTASKSHLPLWDNFIHSIYKLIFSASLLLIPSNVIHILNGYLTLLMYYDLVILASHLASTNNSTQ